MKSHHGEGIRHVFSPTLVPCEGIAVATGGFRHRLCNVLRVQRGETLVLRDEAGTAVVAEVVELSREHVTLNVRGPAQLAPPPPLALTLVQAMGKGERFEEVLQHGTELGVSHFIPLITRRTIRRPAESRGRELQERWKRILTAATEQARREAVPQIALPCTLHQAVELTRQASQRYVLHTEGTEHLAGDVVASNGSSVALFVGPEGGFDAEEIAFLQSHDVRPKALGPYILRTETAALAATALLLLKPPAG